MKKIILVLFLAVGLSLCVGGLMKTYAQSGDFVELPEGDFLTMIGNIGNIVFTALLILGALMLVVAGILFVTAGGNADQVKQAREWVIWALVGIGVGVLAKGTINFIVDKIQ